MTKTAQKYGVRMEGISFSRETIRNIPIWYHGEAEKRIRRIANSQASQCLRCDHNVKTTGDALDIAEISLNRRHRKRDDCPCEECENLWDKNGCIGPNSCITRAKELLDTLPPKWDPRETLPDDFEKEMQNAELSTRDEDWVKFKKQLVTARDTGGTFGIFTEDPKSEVGGGQSAWISKHRNSILTREKPTTDREQLAGMTQSKAYEAVKELRAKKRKVRQRTKAMIDLAKAQIEETFGETPSEPKIWKTMRSKDFMRKSGQFLWFTAHDAYMVGTQWLRESFNDTLKERAYCELCNGKIDSMQRILTECDSPGQEIIWDKVKALWEKTESIEWMRPGVGTIIGAGVAKIKDRTSGKDMKGDARLWKILIEESAYLLWRMRCERVIRNKNEPFTEAEVSNRWEKMMNERLQLDRRLTNKRFERKALSEEI
ncbi:hypothetical protein PM082_018440 [Marasmius tenuissimus]|nr:hypothetical protein PM082_018440 [Marasmius tenuissimus]